MLHILRLNQGLYFQRLPEISSIHTLHVPFLTFPAFPAFVNQPRNTHFPKCLGEPFSFRNPKCFKFHKSLNSDKKNMNFRHLKVQLISSTNLKAPGPLAATGYHTMREPHNLGKSFCLQRRESLDFGENWWVFMVFEHVASDRGIPDFIAFTSLNIHIPLLF